MDILNKFTFFFTLIFNKKSKKNIIWVADVSDKLSVPWKVQVVPIGVK